MIDEVMADGRTDGRLKRVLGCVGIYINRFGSTIARTNLLNLWLTTI